MQSMQENNIFIDRPLTIFANPAITFKPHHYIYHYVKRTLRWKIQKMDEIIIDHKVL